MIFSTFVTDRCLNVQVNIHDDVEEFELEFYVEAKIHFKLI